MAGKDLKELVAKERARKKRDAAVPKQTQRLNKVFEQVSDKQIAAALSGDQKISIKFWRRLECVSEYEMKQTPGFKKLQDRLAPSFAKVSYIAINYCDDHILTADVSALILGQANVRDTLTIALKWNKEKFIEQAEKKKRLDII
jgi:hypothetical protein